MITVVGSFVVDLMARCPHLPVPGETVLGGPFKMGPGGKGSNQAVAAAKAGSKVNMVTKLGNDSMAEIAKECWSSVGIDYSGTPIDQSEATGIALIMVDSNTSENSILVASGTCLKLTKEEVDACEDMIKESNVVMTQLEVSMEATLEAAKLANKHGAKFIFNPAPFSEFPQELVPLIDFATPNETEAGHWAGVSVVDDASAVEAAQKIVAKGVKNVIITLGKRGCLVYEENGNYEFVDSFTVEAVDTTGAGDAFNGGFAHALDLGLSLKEAVRYGSAVGALSVTKIGTAPAMPTSEEIEAFLANH